MLWIYNELTGEQSRYLKVRINKLEMILDYSKSFLMEDHVEVLTLDGKPKSLFFPPTMTD